MVHNLNDAISVPLHIWLCGLIITAPIPDPFKWLICLVFVILIAVTGAI